MAQTIKADLCIIGGGSGGLYVAAGAAQLGARTVLIERDAMGGDCLNHGCIPSKALLAAAKSATAGAAFADAGAPDTAPRPAPLPFARAHAHVHEVIASIAPHDSVERFEGLGCTVIQAHARFADPRTVVAGDTRVRARRFVVATGSRPAVPAIPGLDDGPYLTNETLFDLTACPEHLIVLGGGPIGVEMAQAHRRLGARVTVLEADRALNREDPELAQPVVDRLRAEGVAIHERVRVDRVDHDRAGGVRVVLTDADGRSRTIDGSHLLVATGRRPTLDGLDLEAAGIDHGAEGIRVDARLRTSNRRVFAIGDCTGGRQFTHMAGYEGGIVIRNALFRLPAKATDRSHPRVTYTEPELAQAGLTEAEARRLHGDRIRVFRAAMADNDRARAERQGEGLAKLVLDPHGRIAGVGIAGAHAGELLQPWLVALSARLGPKALTGMIAPYPTLGEINKRLAGLVYADRLFSAKTRALVRLLQKF
ncbi:pyruvate/2-oxoglutarate dehydrogenase complex dihydrolipoamide dehydrogenase (E3) component [Rhodothalassium salexigens DSM 2132]|uniref:Pyruvate/2-oxoglutarate dehydrogenase complex dihydrolipoamide dehydrogenase (E3) component n=1 Tax=Rhodothalassium salexigens DSM 2132 TaxID=1188247 RepID=A0A4R2PQM9_RHOSA|nr:FAD-dependent oxidoreductase [Rhodothalassium salexigens]MBB4210937.1 pyruvate/2-oxoglutarate dehydrogenase complex dihydrolipoamide dehydrogenase (E3) component [Rhodothalassium salexigens DSM 2132]MBK1639813.1 dihydrolipoamide dehydrogenase [Rhodothalassium salexigens DSM 2132]TCP36405.1 pyruvate/2-oxoglutarate dehydrogenase complex dihydrolipoamide dehydrogenase (E3) component [Rhodothalassium salexigens DSM 2132]